MIAGYRWSSGLNIHIHKWTTIITKCVHTVVTSIACVSKLDKFPFLYHIASLLSKTYEKGINKPHTQCPAATYTVLI